MSGQILKMISKKKTFEQNEKNDSVKNLNKAVSGVRTFHTWYQTHTGSKAWYRKSELTLICNAIIQQLSRKTDKLWSKTCNGQLRPREMFYYFFALKKPSYQPQPSVPCHLVFLRAN